VALPTTEFSNEAADSPKPQPHQENSHPDGLPRQHKANSPLRAEGRRFVRRAWDASRKPRPGETGKIGSVVQATITSHARIFDAETPESAVARDPGAAKT